MILKAFKYQLNPTKEQLERMNKHFGCARFVYNWGLNEKSKAYAESKTNLKCLGLSNTLTEMKKAEEFSWLKEVHSQVLQMSLRNLDNAYTSFFKKKAQFPNFKKKNRNESFQYPQGVKVDGNIVYLPKIGHVRFFKSRDIIGAIKTVTVSKTPTGKIFISILCDTGINEAKKKPILKETSVGLDLGIKSLITTSDGEVFENQKHLRKNLKRLRVEQRKLQRCKKDSSRREKQRIIVAKLHERITNQRKDNLQKISTYLVRSYDTIVMEDLNVSGMMKNSRLSLFISEVGWSSLVSMIEYKCNWYGKNFIRIGRFEPSSKRCNHCGNINKNLTLKDRSWVCPNCNTTLDRDFNAGLNIRDYGLGIQPSDAKTGQ